MLPPSDQQNRKRERTEDCHQIAVAIRRIMGMLRQPEHRHKKDQVTKPKRKQPAKTLAPGQKPGRYPNDPGRAQDKLKPRRMNLEKIGRNRRQRKREKRFPYIIGRDVAGLRQSLRDAELPERYRWRPNSRRLGAAK